MLNDFSFLAQLKLSRLRHFFFPPREGEMRLEVADCLFFLGLSLWLTLSTLWEDADEGEE
ncbi:MAG: hypothetical protein ACRCYP_01345 [Alphaproteobacteria bacterium]